MFREKTVKFLYKSTLFLFLIGFNVIVVGQKVDTIDKIDYNELLDQFFDVMTEEDYKEYFAIYSKLSIDQLMEYNEVLLKRNLDDLFREKATNKWMLMSEEQIINSVYNQGVYYEILLKYSLSEYELPYNKLSLSKQMELGGKVEKDSVYRSRKRDVCGLKNENEP